MNTTSTGRWLARLPRPTRISIAAAVGLPPAYRRIESWLVPAVVVLRGRARVVHGLDLENLVGGRVDVAAAQRLWDEYDTAVRVAPTDVVVVAVSERFYAAARRALPPRVHLVCGHNGPDGADTALIRALRRYRRLESLHLGSGDHFFADYASGLQRRGVAVTQVIGVGHTSLALYRACPQQISLPSRYPQLAALPSRRRPRLRVLPGAPIRVAA